MFPEKYDKYKIYEGPHLSLRGCGTQVIYRVGKYGLSCIDNLCLHLEPFAWEIAVLRFNSDDDEDVEIDYSTPLTDDVEVFSTEEEAIEFIDKAIKYFESIQKEEKSE